MKKLRACVVCLLMGLALTGVCYAGDIPESLLYYDDAQTYFGEVKAVGEKSITVIQRQNIKGEFTQDDEITYKSFEFTESPEVGEWYLCGFLNDDNPLSVWKVTGFDPATLEIEPTQAFALTMQTYLNEGEFAKKEEERLEKRVKAEAFANRNGVSEPPLPSASELPKPAPAEESGMHPTLLPVLLCALVAIGCALFLSRRNRRRGS